MDKEDFIVFVVGGGCIICGLLVLALIMFLPDDKCGCPDCVIPESPSLSGLTHGPVRTVGCCEDGYCQLTAYGCETDCTSSFDCMNKK